MFHYSAYFIGKQQVSGYWQIRQLINPAEASQSSREQWLLKTLKLSDGASLRYTEKGSGRPIVLLHGWGMQGKFFDQQVVALSPDFRVIVPDLRGHGRSSPLISGLGVFTLVDDVAELLVALDVSKAMLIGWSMGAMVAWGVMQGTQKRRIAGLVTIDMVPRLLNDESWKFGLREGQDSSVFLPATQRMVKDWPSFTRFFVPRIFARGNRNDRKALANQIIEDTEQNDADSMAQLWMSMAEQDFRDDVAKINIPTLVVRGALSQLYTEAAIDWVVDQMPNARRVDFAYSGHAPHLEEPGNFTRLIENFADEIKDSVGG